MSLGRYQSSVSFNKEGFVNASLEIMNKNQRGGDFALQKMIEDKQIILLLGSQSLRLVQNHLTVTETTTGTSTSKGTSELGPQQTTPHHQSIKWNRVLSFTEPFQNNFDQKDLGWDLAVAGAGLRYPLHLLQEAPPTADHHQKRKTRWPNTS